MKSQVGLSTVFLLGALVVTACAPAPGTTGSREQRPPAAPGAGRTLVMITGAELPAFSDKKLLPTGAATSIRSAGEELLNAKLAFRDERGLPYPVLADALPELNTATWHVLPDGKMETIYHLRPSLSWHDGQPLTAVDFVFSWRVYTTPDFGVSRAGGIKYVEEVTAPDPRTVLIRWSQPYPEAVDEIGILPPLPRHLLEQPYQQLAAEPFMSLPFWREEYVGAGPFKLERREPGAFFEASAFDGFVFGRPRIDRVRVIYIPDPNTAVATLLSGEGHFVIEGILYGEDGLTIEKQWGSTGGAVLWEAISGRVFEIQHRPEYASPQQLATDIRVRKALAYAMDREAMMEAVTAGKGLLRDVYTHPHADYYDTVTRGVARYRHDQRRAQQLLEEAGFARGTDSSWATPTGGRFTLEQWYLAASNNERESHILVDTLRRFGIDATSHVFGTQRTSVEERVKTPGLFGGTKVNPRYHSRDVARAENRWAGNNRFGYANPELDRLLDAYDVTMDRPERIQIIAQQERLAMEDLPAIPLYWGPRVIAYVAGLKGVGSKLVEPAGSERRIWEWEWQ